MTPESLLFSAALGLQSPWQIEHVNLDVESQRLDIKVNYVKGSKFSYRLENTAYDNLPVHDTSEKSWRHLNFFQYQCYITARVPRVRLPNNQVRQIEVPWESAHSGFTKLFEALIVLFAKQLPVHQITEMLGGYDDKIWELLDAVVIEKQAKDDLSKVKQVGIDETYVGKLGYVTTFVDLETKKSLYVHPGKDSETIAGFVSHLESHSGKAKDIRLVTCDMSKAFISGVNKYFPNAEIVFDKFHVIKLLTKAIDDIRKAEAVDKPILKKNKFVFLKNRNNLTQIQSEYLETIELEHYMLDTYQAMRFKEIFQALYKADNAELFLKGFRQWKADINKSNIELLIKACRSIEKHLDGIIPWFDYRVSNAILEGFNSLFKAASARARGYKIFKNVKNIILLISGDFPMVLR